jgi:hypothetical protein
VRVSDDDVASALRRAGAPGWNVDGLVELWRDVYRAGLAAAVAPDVEAVLGRPATPFARFARDHARALSAP